MHSELCSVGVGQVAVTVTIVAVLWQFAVTGTAMAMLSVCCTPVATVLARPGPGPTGNVAMVMSYFTIALTMGWHTNQIANLTLTNLQIIVKIYNFNAIIRTMEFQLCNHKTIECMICGETKS